MVSPQGHSLLRSVIKLGKLGRLEEKKILKCGPLPDDDAFEDICSTLLKLLLCGLYEWSLCKE